MSRIIFKTIKGTKNIKKQERCGVPLCSEVQSEQITEVFLREAEQQQQALCPDQYTYTKTVLKSDCVEKQISSSIPSLESFAILIYFVLHHFHFTKKGLVNYQTNNENIKEILFPTVIIPSLKEITIWQHKSIKYHLFPFFGIYHMSVQLYRRQLSQSVLSAIYSAIWRSL